MRCWLPFPPWERRYWVQQAAARQGAGTGAIGSGICYVTYPAPVGSQRSAYNSLPNGTAHTSGGYKASPCCKHRSAAAGCFGETRQMPDFRNLIEAQIPRPRRYALALTRRPDQADDLVHD